MTTTTRRSLLTALGALVAAPAAALQALRSAWTFEREEMAEALSTIDPAAAAIGPYPTEWAAFGRLIWRDGTESECLFLCDDSSVSWALLPPPEGLSFLDLDALELFGVRVSIDNPEILMCLVPGRDRARLPWTTWYQTRDVE